MKSSKLYSILEYFDKYEQNRLRKFIISPYFNKNEAIIALLDLLFEQINNDRIEDFEKEVLWHKIYSEKTYDDILFRKKLFRLIKVD